MINFLYYLFNRLEYKQISTLCLSLCPFITFYKNLYIIMVMEIIIILTSIWNHFLKSKKGRIIDILCVWLSGIYHFYYIYHSLLNNTFFMITSLTFLIIAAFIYPVLFIYKDYDDILHMIVHFCYIIAICFIV